MYKMNMLHSRPYSYVINLVKVYSLTCNCHFIQANGQELRLTNYFYNRIRNLHKMTEQVYSLRNLDIICDIYSVLEEQCSKKCE